MGSRKHYLSTLCIYDNDWHGNEFESCLTLFKLFIEKGSVNVDLSYPPCRDGEGSVFIGSQVIRLTGRSRVFSSPFREINLACVAFRTRK